MRRPFGYKASASNYHLRGAVVAGAAAFVLSGFLTACGASSSGPSKSGASASVLHWKLNGDQTTGFWWNSYLKQFSNNVSTDTHGKIQVQFYPGSSLGFAPADILSPLSAGHVDLAEAVDVYLAGKDPALSVIGLPMLAQRPAGLKTVMQRVQPFLAKQLSDKYQVHLLGTLISTPLQLFLGKHQFQSKSPLQGLTVRTLGGIQENSFVSALGGNPVTVPVANLPSSLATGQVGGAIAGTQYFLIQKFNQYGPNILAWNAFYDAGFLMISNKEWNGLSKSEQTGLQSAAMTMQNAVWTHAATQEATWESQAKRQGFTILQVPPSTASLMNSAAKSAWRAWENAGGSSAKTAFHLAQGK